MLQPRYGGTSEDRFSKTDPERANLPSPWGRRPRSPTEDGLRYAIQDGALLIDGREANWMDNPCRPANRLLIDRDLQMLPEVRVAPQMPIDLEIDPQSYYQERLDKAVGWKANIETRMLEGDSEYTPPQYGDEDVRDNAGRLMPGLAASDSRDPMLTALGSADEADLRVVDAILDSFKALTPPARTNHTGLTGAAQKAYVTKWNAVIHELQQARREQLHTMETVGVEVTEAFGAHRVEAVVLKEGGTLVRENTWQGYATYVRDYVFFCHENKFKNVFLHGLSDIAATVVIVFYLMFQAD